MTLDNKSDCLLCGHSADLVNDRWPGYQQPATFKIYSCSNCNTSFCLPRIETNKIYNSIYKNGRYVPGYSRYWKYMDAVKNTREPLDYLAASEDIYWSVREAINTIVGADKSKKILEVGSGLGYLTYALNKAGYNTTGLDISETAVAQAKKNFGDFYLCADLFEYAVANAGTFDAVIFTEVIEHVVEPLLFTGSILKLLKNDGHAIITTPNKSLYPNDIIWKTENPPVHFWWFSEDSFRLIAQKTGSTVSFIKFGKFYKKNYTSIDLKKCRTEAPMQPVLSRDGELLFSVSNKRSFLSSLRRRASKLTIAKNAFTGAKKYFTRLKESSNPNIVVCGDRGKVICAVFQKNKN